MEVRKCVTIPLRSDESWRCLRWDDNRNRIRSHQPMPQQISKIILLVWWRPPPKKTSILQLLDEAERVDDTFRFNFSESIEFKTAINWWPVIQYLPWLNGDKTASWRWKWTETVRITNDWKSPNVEKDREGENMSSEIVRLCYREFNSCCGRRIASPVASRSVIW